MCVVCVLSKLKQVLSWEGYARAVVCMCMATKHAFDKIDSDAHVGDLLGRDCSGVDLERSGSEAALVHQLPYGTTGAAVSLAVVEDTLEVALESKIQAST